MLQNYYICLFFLSLTSCLRGMYSLEKQNYQEQISFGAILDLTSRSGREQKVAIEIAVESFHAHVTHQPILHIKDSTGDPARALHIAKALIKKYHVRAIIGIGTWKEALMVAELCNQSGVPVLSLTNDHPTWASLQWPFLVNSVHSQDAQLGAVAAIVQSWQWRKINVIYEESIPTGATSILEHSFSVLQETDLGVADLLALPPTASYPILLEKLESLKHGQCRVFVVHTSLKLATGIFMAAKRLGMIEKDYVWITTNEISSFVETLNASTISTMQGILGVKSYLSCHRRQCNDFFSRFRGTFSLQYPEETYLGPSISALNAYDATWAVVLALKGKTRKAQYKDLTDPNDSAGSPRGKLLLDGIFQSDFEGLTGSFKFTDGKLYPSHIFQVINVIGKSYIKLGYWTEGMGFSEKIGPGNNYSKSMSSLGEVLWPGGPRIVPRGWTVATDAKPLRIGVPTTATFKEFMNVRNDTVGGNVIVDGFSIDVFKAMVKLLPYDLPYEFFSYEGTYDSLIQQIHSKTFDAVVADTSIIANRCNYAQFSQPYTETGLKMVVYVKPGTTERTWLFKKPFTSMMWVLTGIINVYNGFVVWLIERNYDPSLRGTVWNQIGAMLSLAFTILFSHQGERLHSNLSRMVMIVWLLVALIITQSFTASLTTLLTVERLDPPLIDVETLKKNGAKVGCNGNGFLVKYLEVVLGFKPENIVKVYSEEEYPGALIRGEIAAAFMELPYIKLFVAKNCKGFATSGPTFTVGGFGFAFPKGSPYLPDVSEAILKLYESGMLREIESSLIHSNNCTASKSGDHDPNSLGVGSFLGLFVITGGTTTFAFILYTFRYIYENRIRFFRGIQHNRPQDDEILIFVERQHQHPFEYERLMLAWEMQNQGQ